MVIPVRRSRHDLILSDVDSVHMYLYSVNLSVSG